MKPNNFVDSDFGHWKQGAKVEISKPGGVTGFQTGWLCMECRAFVTEDDPPAKCPECGRKMLKPGITMRGDEDGEISESV